jgi:hypothetical protein
MSSNRFVLGFGLVLLLIEFAFPHLVWDARDLLASAITAPKHRIAAEQQTNDRDVDRTGSIIRANAKSGAKSGTGSGAATGLSVWRYTVRPPEGTVLMQHSVRPRTPAANMQRLRSDASPPRIAPPDHQAARL